MSLQSNRLLTLYELGNLRGHKIVQQSSGSSETLINIGSDHMETECNRTFLSGSMGTKNFVGQGHNHFIPSTHITCTLVNVPITTSPHAPRLYVDSNGDGTYTLIDITTYTYDATTGEFYFIDGVSYFLKDIHYKIEYWYGFDGSIVSSLIPGVPWEVKVATAIAGRLGFISVDYAGITRTEADGGRSINLKEPTFLLKVIEKYRR